MKFVCGLVHSGKYRLATVKRDNIPDEFYFEIWVSHDNEFKRFTNSCNSKKEAINRAVHAVQSIFQRKG